jgi:hypothetical protein
VVGCDFFATVILLELHAGLHAGVFKRKRTVSFRLRFNACFGQPVDVAGREAVDQGGVLARVSWHREEL